MMHPLTLTMSHVESKIGRRLFRLRRAIAAIGSAGLQGCSDWWSFQIGTIGIWLDRTPETPEDWVIRQEGERIRKAFPWIDFDHPGARQVRRQMR